MANAWVGTSAYGDGGRLRRSKSAEVAEVFGAMGGGFVADEEFFGEEGDGEAVEVGGEAGGEGEAQKFKG